MALPEGQMPRTSSREPISTKHGKIATLARQATDESLQKVRVGRQTAPTRASPGPSVSWFTVATRRRAMESSTIRAYRAAENLYHRYLTGLILRTVVTRGTAEATELVFRLFRRQQQATLLPGLKKLGLDGLPDAVACAQYHYLSNYLGNVGVQYGYESDRKAWVRYPPPRWIWDGTAICGIPTEVSRAMLRGWHAHNGVTLGNPRLGFVCTMQTTDGQPGLEGYFYEYDHDLAPDERLRLAPQEESPELDLAAMPALDVTAWPQERRQRALRNYAMQYVRNILPEMVTLFGPEDTAELGRTTARLIGMQYYAETAALLNISEQGATGFGAYMVGLGQGQDDDTSARPAGNDVIVRQPTWRLMRDAGSLSPSVFDALNGLWEGALAVHDRFLSLEVAKRLDRGDDCFEWRIRRRVS